MIIFRKIVFEKKFNYDLYSMLRGVKSISVLPMIATGNCRGKSGLHRIAQGVTPLGSNVRNSGTERMSRTKIFKTGTGVLKGVAGVKTAKLCAEQDQIGRRLNTIRVMSSGRIA